MGLICRQKNVIGTTLVNVVTSLKLNKNDNRR